MPREATGELCELAEGYEARITIQGRTRRGFALVTCKTDSEARERCTALAKFAARLRRAGHVDEIVKLLGMGAAARAGRPWEAVVAAVEHLCAGTTEQTKAAPTIKEFGDDWTSNALAARFPDHVKEKRTAERDAENLRLYVYPHVQDVRLDEFTLADAELVIANLPPHLAPASRRHVAQVMARLMNLAVYPGKHIQASPIPRGWLPKPGPPKAKEALFPDEDALLLGGWSVDEGKPSVPFLRRLAYGFLAREGMRVDEMANLLWRDVDLKRGRVYLDENKTDDPRDWDLRPDVVAALKRWRESQDPKPGDDERVFAENGVPLNAEHLADQLRRDLWRVGARRPQLHERSKTRQPVRAHDLRATFVTISLATDRSERWICDRTGHHSHSMVERYRRKARTWNLGPLGPLCDLLPELASTTITRRIPDKHTARVAKLADAADLGSAAARRKGSTPFPCTARHHRIARALRRAPHTDFTPRALRSRSARSILLFVSKGGERCPSARRSTVSASCTRSTRRARSSPPRR